MQERADYSGQIPASQIAHEAKIAAGPVAAVAEPESQEAAPVAAAPVHTLYFIQGVPPDGPPAQLTGEHAVDVTKPDDAGNGTALVALKDLKEGDELPSFNVRVTLVETLQGEVRVHTEPMGPKEDDENHGGAAVDPAIAVRRQEVPDHSAATQENPEQMSTNEANSGGDEHHAE